MTALCLLTACQAGQTPDEAQTPPADAVQETEPAAPASQEQGYLDAAAYDGAFLAVGTQGRMDRIALDGTVTQLDTGMDGALSQVAVGQTWAVAVGAQGGVCLGQDGGILPLAVPVDTPLYSVCFFGDRCLIGGAAGKLLSSGDLADWNETALPVSGNITGLAADAARCMAVTDQGEVAVTTDGSQWTALSYNEYYGKQVRFSGVIQDGSMFWAYGTEADGTAMVVMSTMGNVWTERILDVYSQNQVIDGAERPITDLAFDGTQEIAVFGSETALILPDCTECNLLETVSDTQVTTLACCDGMVLFAGADYTFCLTDNSDVRQYQIKAAAMEEKRAAGALVIDVRGPEEYDQSHIPGSVNIPVDELEDKLPQFCADRAREMIFYCASGKRSAAALEQALAMGYENVFDFGSIDNWPGELITQEPPAGR